jgi:hypothetical protein
MNRAVTAFALCVISAIVMWAADVSGSWTFQVNLDAGSGSPSFSFQQKGDVITGKYQGQLGESEVKGTVKGDQIAFSFKLEQGGEAMTVEYEGTIESASSMKGKAKYGTFASGTWTASKK